MGAQNHRSTDGIVHDSGDANMTILATILHSSVFRHCALALAEFAASERRLRLSG